jgi:hypothetical protein
MQGRVSKAMGTPRPAGPSHCVPILDQVFPLCMVYRCTRTHTLHPPPWPHTASPLPLNLTSSPHQLNHTLCLLKVYLCTRTQADKGEPLTTTFNRLIMASQSTRVSTERARR